MISFDLEYSPSVVRKEARLAYGFLQELIRTHVDVNCHASHVDLNKSQTFIIGRVRQTKGDTLREVCRLENTPYMFETVVTQLIKASGFLPDSSSISLYSENVPIRFYAKAETFIAEFEGFVSMPKTLLPQVALKQINARTISGYE